MTAPAPPAANPPINHLGALTGMRFFAALAVVIGHLIADHNGTGTGRFGLPHRSLVLGGAAVSFFFVLSGFILTYVYKDRLKWSGVKKFYYKRWARIWPLHLVCLLIAIFFVGMAIRQWDMFFVNLSLLQSWVPDSAWVFSFNGVSWSISTEMFFYLMFPFFLIGGQKRFWFKYALLWLAVIAAVVGIQSLANNPAWASYDFDRVGHVNPFLRLPEFCSGMAVGFVFFNRAPRRKRKPIAIDTFFEVLALGSIVGFWFVYWKYLRVSYVIRNAEWGGSAMALWVQYSSMVIVFAIVIYVFARSHGLLSRFLGTKALVFAGEISFALYMIHYLVIIAMDQYDWSASSHSPWVLGACAISISICLSAFLYKLVEMPAKSGLMSLYEGGLKKASLAFPSHISRFLKSPTCWAYVVVLAVSLGTVRASYTPLNVDDRMSQVVASSHAPYKDVQFGDLIRLMGAKATPTATGVQLDLVWQKKGPLKRRRFLHFCDDEGNIISQLGPEEDLFKSAPLMQPVIESIVLPNHKLADPLVTQIGIGFYSTQIDPETNKPYSMLRVSKGPRGMSNFRLHVIGQNQMNNLRRQMANLAALAAATQVEPVNDSLQQANAAGNASGGAVQ